MTMQPTLQRSRTGATAPPAPPPSTRNELQRRVGPIGDAVLAGAVTAGAAGILMIATLFMPWYGRYGSNATAWEIFNGYDVLLFVLALALIGSAAAVALGRAIRLEPMNLRVLSTISMAAVGLLAVLVIVRIQAPPHALDVQVGAFVAFISVCIGTVGGVLMNYPLWGFAADEHPAQASERTAAREVRPAGPVATAEAGWYPDPGHPERLRFWDGSKWTGHTYESQGA